MTTQKKPLDPERGEQAAQNKHCQNNTTNSAQAQQLRLLAHLHAYGSITTIYARKHLDIMHPAGRIRGLRKEGHKIETHWVTELSEAGRLHRVARYVVASREVA